MTVTGNDIRRAVDTDMTSDPEDPHGWMFDCEVVPLAKTTVNTITKLGACWVCRRCGTTVRISSDVTRRPNSGNEAYDELVALLELRSKAHAERKTVHPRCSESKAVREVMEM